MAKKFTLIFFIISLIFSNIALAQTENPYANFNPEKLKENAKYTRNFSPNNYDTKILYSCLSNMIDLCRAQYNFQVPMKHHIKIDSTAQFQADYQAEEDEKTFDNVAPYKTIEFRLRKYGLSGNGSEIISKAKAYLGEAEYSYYDLCLALIQPILKNVRTAGQLLDKQYSYVGIGFNTDKLMKNMYLSIVLGNDISFNNFKVSPGQKDAPYTKGHSGLHSYDDKICKKCSSETGLEALSEYVEVRKDGNVYLTCDDYKLLKKLIGKDGDAIAIDFVQHSQFDCTNSEVDYEHSNRGFVTKPITFQNLMDVNENTNLKSGKLIAKIGTLPDGINLNSDFDVNILIIKENNTVCRTIIDKSIETKNANYNEKINFLKDENSIKTVGEWVAAPEDGTFSVTFPYALNKTDYRYSNFDTLLDQVDAPSSYKINKIEIIAHNSPNYYKDATYQKIQVKRAQFLQKDLAGHYAGIPITISYDYCWNQFKVDIVADSLYYDLSFDSLDVGAVKLKEYNGFASKYLEKKGYLSIYRYYEIKYYVTYQTNNEEKSEDFAVWKFNQALKKKNMGLAMSIENYMIQQIEKNKYTAAPLKRMFIPSVKENQALLNNKLYMQYYLSDKITDEISKNMKSVAALNPTNLLVNFNTTVCEVYQTPIGNSTTIAKLQGDVDKLYSMTGIPKDRINSLNLELQLRIINYLDTAISNTENNALKNGTLAKIKEIRNPVLDSWKNAYKLASYFTKNYDYSYALSLMDPFILTDKTISEDFLFSYISIAAHREETYLSGLFTEAVKMAAEKNPTRLCSLFDKLPYCVLENEEVKAIICKACNR